MIASTLVQGRRRLPARTVLLLLLIGGLVSSRVDVRAEGGEDQARPIDYSREIQPLLSKSCFSCHGADEASRKASLRLDLRESAIAELQGGYQAIVPGDPDASELVFRISEPSETIRMPPAKAGPMLSEEEVERIRLWIAQGAPYDEHWAFVPPQDRPLPAVADPAWPRDGIDHWIAVRLDQEGLRPSPEADRYQLVRRASLDLRGLPPTPEEIGAFVGDPSPDAFEKVVQQFLDDPAFGERWARVWLDLARYADSAGLGSDPLRPDMWRYRDWVIDALNRNMPFDQFTIEQIAGDLLPEPSLDQQVATAFNRNTMTNTEGGTDDEEFRIAAVKDRIDTTIQVWMGLTMACAKCHTHKYDPISHEDYYQFFAIFNQTADNDQPDERPTIPAPSREQSERIAQIDAQVAALQAQIDTSTSEQAEAKATLEEEVARLEALKPTPPLLPVMVELPAEEYRETHILLKGNFLDPGPKVEPGVLSEFHPLPEGVEPDRLGVARWLVDPANPLTARVTVNRYWSRIFGTGLVESEEDFGTQGEPPSHPELLDWLAIRFMESGWDTKALLKRIVLSATYRQTSRVTPELLEKDPRNRWLARAPRYRMEAEMIRDQALALSGLLNRRLGGPSVFPVQPEDLWQAAFNSQRTWTTSTDSEQHRRALYTFWRRTVPYPSMATFDAPSRELCTLRRSRTNTPLQALVTLNDPVYLEASQALGRRIVREGGESLEDRLRYGFLICLGRPATDRELEVLAELYRGARARYQEDAESALAIATEPIGPLPEGADPAEMAAWTALGNVLLNLDGVLTKG